MGRFLKTILAVGIICGVILSPTFVNAATLISAMDGANDLSTSNISTAWVLTASVTNPDGQTAVKRTGSEGALFCTATAGVSYIARTVSTSTLIVGFWFMFDDLPAADVNIFTTRVGGANPGSLKWDSATGQMFLTVDNVDKTPEGPVIAADTWYWADLYANYSADPHTIDWRITEDGDAPGALLTQGSDPQPTPGTITIARVGIGTASNNTGAIYISDLVVSQTGADFPFGPMEIEVLRPNGDGTHNASANTDFLQNNTTAIEPNTTTAYDFINDDPLGVDDTDRISIAAASSAEYLEFTLENTARSDTILGTEFVRRAVNEATGTNHAILRLVDGVSTADHSQSITNNTNIYVGQHHSATKPSGGAWDASAVDGLKIRFNSGDISPIPSLHAFYIGVVREAAYRATVSNVKTINGLAIASVKTVLDLAIASVKRLDGLE